MKQSKCDHCGGVGFVPRQADQRFCSRECKEAYFIIERQEAVAAFRQQRQHREEEEQQRA